MREEREERGQALAVTFAAESAEAPAPGSGVAPAGRSELTPRQIIALQRSAGNAQVTRLIEQRARSRSVQRWPELFHTAPVDDPDLSDEQRLAQTASGTAHDIRRMYVRRPELFGRATDDQRIGMLRLLHQETWVAPLDESAMEAIWDSFGRRIADVANDHQQLWRDCIEDGAELHTIDAVRGLRDAFARDCREIAAGYLRSNLGAARDELRALGLEAPLAGQVSPTHDIEVGLRRREISDLMQRVRDAQAAQQALTGLPVGYGGELAHGDADHWVPVPTEGPSVWEEQTFGEDHVSTSRVAHETAYFAPGQPPRHAPRGSEQPPFYTHAELQERWETAQRYIDVTATQSPAVFAAVDQERVGEAAGAPSPEQALQVVGDVLRRLEANIRETKDGIASGDIDFRSLKPIHEQMYAGRVAGPSRTNWSSLVARAVGEGVVADEEAWQMWRSLIVGLLAAGAFIAAEIFSGGLATPLLIGVGVGLGIGQAAYSWENYLDLATASRSAASAETRVATPDQAEAALFQAVLDTVFAFLDAASPAWRAGRALLATRQVAAAVERTAMRQAGRVGELIAAGSSDEAARIVRATVNEFGVQGAIDQTGQSAGDLARLFPGEAAENIAMRNRLLGASSFAVGAEQAGQSAEQLAAAESARRSVRAAMAGENAAARAFLESAPLEGLIPQIVRKLNDDVITRTMADELVLEAVERLGPRRTLDLAGGWGPLSTALTNESAAAAPLLAWRRGIFEDLKEYAQRELGEAIPDQGSSGAFKNDLDISFMGERGAANRARARAFVAARAGIEDSNAALNRHLMMELFTDPRRLRAYDALPDVMRERLARAQTAYERELIPNRDLHAARGHGDADLEQAILAQMARDGVREIAYRPLSAGEVERLAFDLDRLHAELLAAVRAGDEAAQEAAARQLGQSQALMNAAEEGGYFTGGSARRYVTHRDPANTMSPLVPRRGATALSSDEVGAMVDQLSKLNHAAAELTHGIRPGGLRDDIVSALRAIAKYGGRAAEVAGGRQAAETGWEGLIEACAALKRAADGELAANLLRQSPDQTVALARQLLGEVREHSMQALQRIRQAAGDLGPGNAEAVNQAIRDHVFVLRLIDRINHVLAFAGRAVNTGTRLIYDDATDAPTPEVSPPGDYGDPAGGRRRPGPVEQPPAAVPA